MKAVIQRVSECKVTVGGEAVGSITNGFLILLGVENGDTEKDAEKLSAKISGLRIFTDENDKMNLSLQDIDGEILAVSNFTLSADCPWVRTCTSIWRLRRMVTSTTIRA